MNLPVDEVKDSGKELYSYRSVVSEIKDDLPRPLWSVMIPAYNCYNYITETLKSVLVQDPGPEIMQIEVVDDCSTDGDLEKLITRLSGKRVDYFRQQVNTGHIFNFNTCLNRSRGQLLHLLHGDDYVKPGFYKKLQTAFETDKQIGAAFTRQIFINASGEQLYLSPIEQEKSGQLTNHLELLALEQKIMTPSIVVRREVYESLGGFDKRLICSEDWEMWIRIASQYPVWYETEPLAVYRIHNSSNTGRHIRSAEDIFYTRLAINIFKDYLPPGIATFCTGRALNTYARSAINNAIQMLRINDYNAARSQIREAFKCSNDSSVYLYLVRSFLKYLKQRISFGPVISNN